MYRRNDSHDGSRRGSLLSVSETQAQPTRELLWGNSLERKYQKRRNTSIFVSIYNLCLIRITKLRWFTADPGSPSWLIDFLLEKYNMFAGYRFTKWWKLDTELRTVYQLISQRRVTINLQFWNWGNNSANIYFVQPVYIPMDLLQPIITLTISFPKWRIDISIVEVKVKLALNWF